MKTYIAGLPHVRLAWAPLLMLIAILALPSALHAQEPSQRQLRSYIPPDQLVSFSASTPFDTFIEFVNPIFERVTDKSVVDPEGRTEPIGVSIAQMHFFDAFELVLEANGLVYRETSNSFVVQEPTSDGETVAVAGGGPAVQSQDVPATAESHEVRINALFFELNRTKAREMGLNWSTFLGGPGGGGQGGGTGTGTGGQTGAGRTGSGTAGGGGNRLYVRTDDFFDQFGDFIDGPDMVELSTLADFIRLLESESLGETIANPTITVQSAEQGRIQIGSDVPVQTRDFAGNTVTQFFSTGVIVDVTPTVLSEPVADTVGAPVVDFIHMDVQVENSSSRPSGAGAPIIDRSVANTQVLFLDGEQTMIGGLYSTDRTVSRRGIPLLKDLPPWFFGLRYVFGYDQVNRVQKELMIVLQAEVMEPVMARFGQPPTDDMLEERREEIRQTLQRFSEDKGRDITLPSEINE